MYLVIFMAPYPIIEQGKFLARLIIGTVLMTFVFIT